MKMEEKLTPIKLNTWVSQTVIGFLEERFGGNQVRLGIYANIMDRVF